MKERQITQIAVIDEPDPKKFQEQVNSELLAHSTVTGIEYRDGSGKIIAIITYTEVLQEIETVSDYFALMGKHYVCNDCSACELDPDRRSTTHYCRKHNDRIRLKTPACEWFLQGLQSGDLHLVTPEERQKQYDRMDAEEMERRKERLRIVRKIKKEENAIAEKRKNRRRALPDPGQITDK